MGFFRFPIWFVLLLFPLIAYAQKGDDYLAQRGLEDISELDPSIQVHLMYAYPDNIMGEAVYTGITKAWLRPEAAVKLLKAQTLLKSQYPQRSLIVYDAARPMSVQHTMWKLVRGTDKTNYVANPANGGGLHNYGMAVDVSILDESGNPIPMGSAVDHFGYAAHTNNEESLLEAGTITCEEFENRRFLRHIMRQAGFHPILYEWWHFNACSREEARRLYPVIE